MNASALLADVRSRALVSSEDRPAWLAARALGVTATEVAKLRNGGIGARRELIGTKLNGSTFKGTKYTEWGSVREAAIAEDVRARTAIEPNQFLFHAAGNVRMLATPDGVGSDFDGFVVLSEIKTSKHDLTPGPVDAHGVLVMEQVDEVWRAGHFWHTTYYDQMQWQMFVMDAVRTRFTWEQHDDDWSGWPARGPMPLHTELPWMWVLRDEERIAELLVVASAFLLELDAAVQAREAGEGPLIDEELDTRAVNLLRFRDMESEGKRAKEAEWSALLDALAARGGEFSQESALARITYTPAVVGMADVVDEDAAAGSSAAAAKRYEVLVRARASLAKKEASWAEFAKKFTKSVPTSKRAGLTVTAVKTKETKK